VTEGGHRILTGAAPKERREILAATGDDGALVRRSRPPRGFLLAPARPGRSQDPVVAAAGDIACDPADRTSTEGTERRRTAARWRRRTSSSARGSRRSSSSATTSTRTAPSRSSRRRTTRVGGRVKAITRPRRETTNTTRPPRRATTPTFGPRPATRRKGGTASTSAGGTSSSSTRTAPPSGLRRGLAAGAVASGRPRRPPGRLHPRRMAPPALLLRNSRQRPGRGCLLARLYDAGADVVLNGHDHVYERFDPQDPDGLADRRAGFASSSSAREEEPNPVRHDPGEQRRAEHRDVRCPQAHAPPGRLRLQFLPAAGGSYADAGSGTCHRARVRTANVALSPLPPRGHARQPGPVGRPRALRGHDARRSGGLLLRHSGLGDGALAERHGHAAKPRGPSRPGGVGPPGSGHELAQLLRGADPREQRDRRDRAYGRVAATPVLTSPAGTAHLVLDVAGYWE